MDSGTENSKSEGLLSRMALNDNKAGMEGLDRDKINKIIMESSKVNTSLPGRYEPFNQCRIQFDQVIKALS